MGRRWSDAMVKPTIGSMHLLIWQSCMLVLVKRLMNNEIIIS
jgi:hypothetical protein